MKLLIILHRLAQDGSNTPPPLGTNTNTLYFPLSQFVGSEYYVDSLEDSDAEVRGRVGGKRGVPREDHKFEERLEDIRSRIRRQEDLLAKLERKHKALFAAAVHDANTGRYLQVLYFGPNDDLTGKQVVAFRQVIIDYLTDLTQRTNANTANAASLTDAQINTAAVTTIMADIDRGTFMLLSHRLSPKGG